MCMHIAPGWGTSIRWGRASLAAFASIVIAGALAWGIIHLLGVGFFVGLAIGIVATLAAVALSTSTHGGID